MALNDQVSYDMGWYTLFTPNGGIVWHDGDTRSFGFFVGLLPHRHVGVIILTNETNESLIAFGNCCIAPHEGGVARQHPRLS